MKIVLLDAQTLGECDLTLFTQLGDFNAYPLTSTEQRLAHIGDNEIIITNKVVIDEQVIKANPQLKLICITATGTNNVDLIAAEKAGVVVKNVAGYSTESVAQSTFSMLFQLVHQSRYYDNYTRSGGWCSSPIFTHLQDSFFEIKGKRWGIIGFGAIGRRVADIATAFGCEVCYFSTSGKNSQQAYQQVDLATLLSSCDIISIHAPLNEQTLNLIDAQALAQVKEKTIILNLGRGGIIDEYAMAKAIDNAGLYHGTDVLAEEPMVEGHPYLSVQAKARLVITPHIAWASREAKETLIKAVANNIKSTFM
ncbi:D-2-hydroxyacid dehydrogenase [Psychromonas sp. MME2]|uniref:D-2-hydroxyacid dehydrogenase n=1 Tax=unclassified Psychromonas TaxID=2614957 RepID=UPI00339CC515